MPDIPRESGEDTLTDPGQGPSVPPHPNLEAKSTCSSNKRSLTSRNNELLRAKFRVKPVKASLGGTSVPSGAFSGPWKARPQGRAQQAPGGAAVRTGFPQASPPSSAAALRSCCLMLAQLLSSSLGSQGLGATGRPAPTLQKIPGRALFLRALVFS